MGKAFNVKTDIDNRFKKLNKNLKESKARGIRILEHASLIDRLAKAAQALTDSCGCGHHELYYSEKAKDILDAVLAEYDLEKKQEKKDNADERRIVRRIVSGSANVHVPVDQEIRIFGRK